MSRLLCSIILCGAFSLPAAGQLVPVFEYRFPESYAGGEDFAAVTDQSTAGNEGTIRGAGSVPVELSTDVPTGAPASARSLDLFLTPGSILTDGTKLLDLPGIIANGGFTFEVWFKGIPTSSSKIVDYAGTHYLAARPSDTDVDGKVGEVFVSVGNGILPELILDEDDGLDPVGWNHAKLVYTVTDASNPVALKGHATVILNGQARTVLNRDMSDFGDSLNRPTAVGSHPTIEDGSTGDLIELYNGLVYNPAVYFGTDITAPLFGLVEGNAAGFTAEIIDTTSPVAPDSVTVTLDGQPIAVTAVREEGKTTINYLHPTPPLPGGSHKVIATYKTQAGDTFSGTITFNSTGSAVEPVLEYHFPVSYDGSQGNVVEDQSTAENHGSLNVEVPLSDDVPFNAPAGTAALDLTEGAASIITDEIDLLTSSKVLTAGGFTYDIWFKGPATANLNKIIDFAGTDWLAASNADSDGDGNVGEVVISIGNNYNASLRLDTDDGYLPDDWNHAVVTYQVTDGSNVGNLLGTLTINLNGVVRSGTGRAFTGFGDELDRPLGIGSHPLGGEKYAGLLYRPKVSLGVVPSEAPITAISASLDLGLSVALTDKEKAVDAATVKLYVDGNPVTPVVSKADGVTDLGYIPATPFAGGAHTALITFAYEGGGFDQIVVPFYIRGQETIPLFSYVFPFSYDGTSDLQEVFDESPMGTLAIADGQNNNAPIALSTDVPPGAAPGTMSLDMTSDYGVLLTNRRQLLNVPSIIGAGGFTIDLWFKGVPTGGSGLQKIFDYAGTESLSIDTASGQLLAALNSNNGTTLILGEGDGLDPEGWNHVVASFAVVDEIDQTSVIGDYTVTLNGNSVTSQYTLTNLGDSLDRPTAIGAHPTYYIEFYRGLIYNPKLSLGAVSPPPTGNASINIIQNGGTVTVTFEGVLYSSPDLKAAFAPVPGATSPYTVTLPANGQMFFRAEAP